MKKKTYLWIAGIAVLTIAVVVAVVISCHRTEKTVNDFIVEDFETVLNEHANARYYETECVLNGFVDELKTDAKVSSYKQVVQVGDTVHFYNRDFDEKTLDIKKKYGHWSGTFKCDPSDILVSFDEALDILVESGVKMPHSNKMTLRCPMGGASYTPLYIFGSTQSHLYVYVDAVTGEVGNLRGR